MADKNDSVKNDPPADAKYRAALICGQAIAEIYGYYREHMRFPDAMAMDIETYYAALPAMSIDEVQGTIGFQPHLCAIPVYPLHVDGPCVAVIPRLVWVEYKNDLVKEKEKMNEED